MKSQQQPQLPNTAPRREDYHVIWPRWRTPEETLRVRAGRALHWIALAICGGYICYGALAAMVLMPGLFGVLKLTSCLLYGIGFAFAGRMARMVLSQE